MVIYYYLYCYIEIFNVFERVVVLNMLFNVVFIFCFKREWNVVWFLFDWNFRNVFLNFELLKRYIYENVIFVFKILLICNKK